MEIKVFSVKNITGKVLIPVAICTGTACLLGLVFSCKTADLNILGIKTFTFKQKEAGEAGERMPVSREKSDGIFILDGDGQGEIEGIISSSNAGLLVYAQVSFTLKNEDFRKEQWTNFHSDGKGRFFIKNLPPGQYKIAVTQVNAYLTVIDHVVISSGNPRIALTPELKPIE